MVQKLAVPIVTVDGPGGAGKGSVSQCLAQALNWHLLDSGALYRALAYSYLRHDGQKPYKIDVLLGCCQVLNLSFASGLAGEPPRVFQAAEEIGDIIRTEAMGSVASEIAAIPEVRQALLAWQQAFAQSPGLVADGRDMGTVVFPQALLKVFLTASAPERARRRYNQLKEKGKDVSISGLLQEIEIRDARDVTRAHAPLLAAADAVILDTTHLSIAAVVMEIQRLLAQRLESLRG